MGYRVDRPTSLAKRSLVCRVAMEKGCNKLKHVSFNPVVEIFHTYRRVEKDQLIGNNETKLQQNRKGKSQKEKRKRIAIRRRWYTTKEMESILSENAQIIEAAQSRKKNGRKTSLETSDDEQLCVRGLYLPHERRDICEFYEETLKRVLIEQEEQYRSGVSDPDRLAEIYGKASRRSQLQALHRGLQDEYASRGQEHLLVAHHDDHLSPRKSSNRSLTANIKERSFSDRPRSISKLVKRWNIDSPA